MALSPTSLQAKIEASLKAKGYKKVASTNSAHLQYSEPFIKALAEAIVLEIQTNAEVADTHPEASGVWKVL